MRHLIIAAFVLACGAQAASVCASPPEMKALQAAVLEQQLAAAAQSCHATGDYSRFVAVYGGAMVRQDQAVRRFFQRQKTGESYDAYKARIARDVSLKSLHDLRFCHTAKIVFDVALGRAEASEPPALVETGYEGCRPIIDKSVLAAAKPAPSAKLMPVPFLAPVRFSKAEVIPVPKPAPFGPRALAIVLAVKPMPFVAKPVAKPAQLASAQPVFVPPAGPAPEAEDAPETPADAERDSYPEQSAKRYAAAERPQWRRQPLREFGGEDDGVPNAYRSGSQWVGEEADEPPPPRWRERQASNLYRGPDGRWYVRIGRHQRWNDGE